MSPRLGRRRLLRYLTTLPLLLAASLKAPRLAAQTPDDARDANASTESVPDEAEGVPPAGEAVRLLLAGTEFETALHIFTSGRPGKTALVLGGVHGNEPGGWLAADWIVANRRPQTGALLVIPRANRVAISLFERTTESLADLNRSYPGFWDGRPMEQMAAEIVAAIGEHRVDLVHDMHESWSFYRDRSTSGTAFIGQTVAAGGEAGPALATAVVERVNARVLYDHELFSFREPGAPQDPNLPRQQNLPPPGRGTSSLGLARSFPGLTTLLVEMGQQQSLERRIALHVEVLDATLQELGIGVTDAPL